MGDLLIERNQQAPMSDEYPLMAFIANEGVAPKGERYDRSALVTDTVNKLYKKTEKGDFIYSSNNLETGSIGLNKYGKACISPVYSIFEPTGIADSDFLGRRLVRKDFINTMVKWRQGVIYGQWRIHESDFLKIEIAVPSVEEQRKIGTYLDQLDNLITLHQRKYDKLQVLKKAMLEKMFPKNGSSVPEIRFKGFTDAWEQRKLGEIVEIKDSARIPNNEWSDIGVPYIRASDISSENLKGTLFISSERYEFYKNKTGAPMRGDVLFNGGGEIGKSIICNDSKPIYVQGGAVLYARTSASNELEASYLKTYYETSHSRKYIDAASAGGTMKHFTLKPAQEMPVYLPEAEEQKQIGDFYICIDNLITLHQRELEKLQNIKKSMLEKMFV